MDKPKTRSVNEFQALHDQLCADLSKENNMEELKLLATELNVPSSGRKKAQLCEEIAVAIEIAHNNDKYCNYFFEYANSDDPTEKNKSGIKVPNVYPARYVHRFPDKSDKKFFYHKMLTDKKEGSVFDLLGDSVEADGYIVPTQFATIDEKQRQAVNEYIGGNVDTFLMEAFAKSPIVSAQQKYTLYRGLRWYHKSAFDDFIDNCHKGKVLRNSRNFPSSWTSNICIAEHFALSDNWGVVLKYSFNLEDILVDTRILENGNMAEREVIVKPGEYKCNIYEIFMNKKPYKPDGTPILPIIL